MSMLKARNSRLSGSIFFYHPIRVNRELIDEELPDPDTVKNVRLMFEKYIEDEESV